MERRHTITLGFAYAFAAAVVLATMALEHLAGSVLQPRGLLEWPWAVWGFRAFMGTLAVLAVWQAPFLYDLLRDVKMAVALLSVFALACIGGTLSVQDSDLVGKNPAERYEVFVQGQATFLHYLAHFWQAEPSYPLSAQQQAQVEQSRAAFGEEAGLERAQVFQNHARSAERDRGMTGLVKSRPLLFERLHRLAQTMQLTHAYRSWWFRTMLCLLTFAVIVGTISRFAWSWSKLGFVLTHAGVVTVFVGAFFSSTTTLKGLIPFQVGQYTVRFIDQLGGAEIPLGFRVDLRDFVTEYHREIFIRFPRLERELGAGLQRSYKPHQLTDLTLDQGRYRIRTLKFLPRAVSGKPQGGEGGELFVEYQPPSDVARDDFGVALEAFAPRDVPALLLELTRQGEPPRVFWLAADDPRHGHYTDGDIEMLYVSNTMKMPDAWRSLLEVQEEGVTMLRKVVTVNDPLYYKGFVFYQTDARQDDPSYSGIQAVSDPGWRILLGGIIAALVGIATMFWINPFLKRRTVAA